MSGWLRNLRELAARADPCVLVTVAGTRGSTPRDVGAKMIVTPSETIGTIGGGRLEFQCVEAACQWLRQGEEGRDGRSQLCRFALGSRCGQCCGGIAEILFEQITPSQKAWIDPLAALAASETPTAIVTARQSRAGSAKLLVTADTHVAIGDGLPLGAELLSRARQALERGSGAQSSHVRIGPDTELPVLIETVLPDDFRIVIFGAGHVGTACVGVLSMLDSRIELIDSRPGFPGTALPENVRAQRLPMPALAVDTAPGGCYFLVMTHDHALDFEICCRILRRRDFAYCGLIGSRSKRRRFETRFRAIGLAAADIQALTCPIGIDGIAGKHPAEIAIAVAAELIGVRERRARAGNSSVTQRRDTLAEVCSDADVE